MLSYLMGFTDLDTIDAVPFTVELAIEIYIEVETQMPHN